MVTETPRRGPGRPTHAQSLATARVKEEARAAERATRGRSQKEDMEEVPPPKPIIPWPYMAGCAVCPERFRKLSDLWEHAEEHNRKVAEERQRVIANIRPGVGNYRWKP